MLIIKHTPLKGKTAPGKKIQLSLELTHTPMAPSVQTKIGKNIAVAIDVSSSMNDPIKRARYPEFVPPIAQRPAPVFPFPNPINPVNPINPNPINPVNPFDPFPNQPFNPFPMPKQWPSTNPHPFPGNPVVFGGPNRTSIFTAHNSPLPSQPFDWNAANQIQAQVPASIEASTKKIQLAIQALQAAVDVMGEDDYFSLLAFNERTRPIVKAIKMTAENKVIIRQQINQLSALGNTDVHLGWLDSCGLVSENFSPSLINRVLILSDGQTNSGLRSQKAICDQVAQFLDKGISTSTFGIGEDFNELLMQAMSEAGGGDFHYIESNQDFLTLFSKEINNVSSCVASQIFMSTDKHENVVSAKNLNDFAQRPNGYAIPNLVKDKKVEFLLEIEHCAGIGQNVVMPLVFTFLDTHSKTVKTVHHTISIDCTNEAEYDALLENKSVADQLKKLQTANVQAKAGAFVASGDMASARSLIANQISDLSSYDAQAMNGQIQTLSAALGKFSTDSMASSAKFLRSTSHSTRYGKSDDAV